MIEFDYKLDYKNTLFRPNDNRYRIGRAQRVYQNLQPTLHLVN